MIPDLERSARMAYKTLLALHIDSFPIQPLQILSFCRNTVVRTYADVAPFFGMSDPTEVKYCIMDNRDAVTIRHDFGGAVGYELFYDHHANPFRKRFTLGHELGHIILKHSQESWWEEREADAFASQLLAPCPVLSLLSEHGFDVSNPDILSDIFGLSRSASEVTARQRPIRSDCEQVSMLCQQFLPWIESLPVRSVS